MEFREMLSHLRFGQPVAEEEHEQLHEYFVQTSAWQALRAGEVDIVLGAKGSGKSALHALLLEEGEARFPHGGPLVVPGENMRGAAAFRELLKGQTPTEVELEQLWRLYLLTLIADSFVRNQITTPEANVVVKTVQSAGLLSYRQDLAGLVARLRDRVSRKHVEAAEGSVALDPNSGAPVPSAKLVFGDRTPEISAPEAIDLLKVADRVLKEVGVVLWLSLDRLDVAFAGGGETERTGLRALLRVYGEFRALDCIRLKLFLRSEIWGRLLEGGFTEASHFVRKVEINWEYRPTVINLVVRRLLADAEFVRFLGVNPAEVLASFESQEEFILGLLPPMRISGEDVAGVDAVIAMCRNGNDQAEPREVIQFLEAARQSQVDRLAIGCPLPAEGHLFDSEAMDQAHRIVSKIRMDQTVIPENAKLVPLIRNLKGVPEELDLETLQDVWSTSPEKAEEFALALEDAGVLKRRGALWIVPLLYQPALEVTRNG